MTSFEVLLSDEAIRDADRLPKDIVARLYKKLEAAAANPYHYLERLSGVADWKLRVGDYRAVVIINFSTQTILVERMGHRKNIYER